MTSTSKGNFVWYEHLTRDPEQALAFYAEVAGWKSQPFGNDGYVMLVGSQGPLGGVMKLPDDAAKMGAPPHWMGDVQVDDVDATVARVAELGGTIYHPATDIPTVGRFAVIADPQGAVIAVFTPGGPMEQHDSGKEGEFCWNELMTRDPAAAFGFYADVFGWKAHDAMDMGPMGTYQIFGAGDRALGGMMAIPPGAPFPPMWVYYMSTGDLEAAIERSKRNGATLMNGPMDVPGGRIAQLTDPQGAMYALHQVAKPAS